MWAQLSQSLQISHVQLLNKTSSEFMFWRFLDEVFAII